MNSNHNLLNGSSRDVSAPAMHHLDVRSIADPSAGLTRTDLLVSILAVGLLLLLGASAFGRAGSNSKSLQCLNNVRRLTLAWRMYADDSRDKIVYSSTGAGGRAGGSVIPDGDESNPDNYAWTGAHLDFNGNNRANWDVRVDMQRRPLWPYTGRDETIYKCPEDGSFVYYQGKPRPRVQSMSMNLYLGGFAGAGSSGLLENGYLNYRVYLKTIDLTSITPSKAFVFMDQRSDAINWGNFIVSMAGYAPSNPAYFAFFDWPGFLHEGGTAFAFADGRGEIHQWKDARTIPPLGLFTNLTSVGINSSPYNPDIAWLQDHATRRK